MFAGFGSVMHLVWERPLLCHRWHVCGRFFPRCIFQPFIYLIDACTGPEVSGQVKSMPFSFTVRRRLLRMACPCGRRPDPHGAIYSGKRNGPLIKPCIERKRDYGIHETIHTVHSRAGADHSSEGGERG